MDVCIYLLCILHFYNCNDHYHARTVSDLLDCPRYQGRSSNRLKSKPRLTPPSNYALLPLPNRAATAKPQPPSACGSFLPHVIRCQVILFVLLDFPLLHHNDDDSPRSAAVHTCSACPSSLSQAVRAEHPTPRLHTHTHVNWKLWKAADDVTRCRSCGNQTSTAAS